jgi:hypothetical protein
MDKETREFIEGSFEKWTGILVNELQSMREDMRAMGEDLKGEILASEGRLNKRMDGIEARLDSKIDTLKRMTDKNQEATNREILKLKTHGGLA